MCRESWGSWYFGFQQCLNFRERQSILNLCKSKNYENIALLLIRLFLRHVVYARTFPLITSANYFLNVRGVWCVIPIDVLVLPGGSWVDGSLSHGCYSFSIHELCPNCLRVAVINPSWVLDSLEILEGAMNPFTTLIHKQLLAFWRQPQTHWSPSVCPRRRRLRWPGSSSWLNCS